MIQKLLPEVCHIQYGFPFDSKRFSNKEGTPLIRIRDVVRGYTETFTTEQCSDDYIVKKGDILIGMDGMFNVAKWNGNTAYLNQRVCKLEPKSSIVANYLFYYLPCALKKIENKTAFVTVKHLKAKQLNSILIPYPSIKEQEKIAQTLDLLFRLIYKKKKQLNSLDELVKSRFLEMFGNMIHASSDFREMTLEEVCRKNGDVRCGPFGTQLSKSDYLDSGVPVWGIPEINSGFQIRASDYISKEKANLLSSYSIISGDIVMSRKGNVGKCEIYPSGYPVGIMHSDVLRIRVNKDLVNPTFLKYQFHFSERIKHQIDIVSHGAIMAGINVTKLKNINVLLPAINRQNQFSEFIHQVDKSKMAVQKSLDELETLKKSLMQTYFG